MNPCFVCGKQPKLTMHRCSHVANGPVLGARYSCSHWLRPNVQTMIMWNPVGWSDLAVSLAQQEWENLDYVFSGK